MRLMKGGPSGWKRSLRRAFLPSLLFLAGNLRAEIEGWAAATRPMEEGVPQVAVIRLRTLLATVPAEADKSTVAAKLAEALLAAGEPEEALKVLEMPQLAVLPTTALWRAQALASRQRWEEALPLYQDAARRVEPPLRGVAIAGQADALRALGRFDEALGVYASLLSDPQWSDRAQLRSIELLLDKRDTQAWPTKKRNAICRAGSKRR
jgi:tetratricopeptide (TPR) repeat protein